MRVPNYPVFDDDGNLYVSDSGTWGARDGFIWKVAPGGTKAEIWRPQGERLHEWHVPVGGWTLSLRRGVLSAPDLKRSRSRPTAAPENEASWSSCRGRCPTASPSTKTGNLYISLYNPNIIYRLSPRGELVTLYDDWEQLMLIAPTNIAFGGREMRDLIIASVCGWSVHTAKVDVPGLPLRYPKL